MSQTEFNDPLWRQGISGAQMLFVAFGALVFALSRDAGHCPKAGRPRFGFPCDGSHASRPSSRHALLTVVSGMPWQSRSSRLQRGSPR